MKTWTRHIHNASSNSTWFVTSRLDTTRSTCQASRAVLFQHGGRRTSYSAGLYKFSWFYAVTYTHPIRSVK